MKILYIDYDDFKNPYANGGQAYTTYQLVSRLKKNHFINVLTGNYPRSKKLFIANLKYTRLGFGNLGYFVSMVSHWMLLPFYVFLNQHKYDLIIECFTAPFTVSLIPIVVNRTLIALPSFFDSKKLSKKYHLPLDIFLNIFIKKYTKFIVLTKELGRKIKKLNAKAEIKIVPGGVSDTLLMSKPINGDYVLYVGRIDQFNKGLDLLLDAWKGLSVKLVIAGSGRQDELNRMNRLIKEYKLNDRVKYIGRVSGSAKDELFRKSMFVVQPSRFETFGYVALETIAAGKILVCFDIEGFRWIPNNYAIKISSISATSLRDGIQKAIFSNCSLTQIASRNKKFARNFQWDKLTSKFERYLYYYSK
jgi:glycosyltransferase involved in cell wall biosynthesis